MEKMIKETDKELEERVLYQLASKVFTNYLENQNSNLTDNEILAEAFFGRIPGIKGGDVFTYLRFRGLIDENTYAQEEEVETKKLSKLNIKTKEEDLTLGG